MQMHVFLALKSAIQSLSTCGEVVIRNGVVRCRAKNLNSPYVSHRMVGFSQELSYEPYTTISNRKYAIRLNALNRDGGGPDAEIHPSSQAAHVLVWDGGMVPVALLEKLRGRMAEVGMGYASHIPQHQQIVYVEVGTRVVDRWDGPNPIFVPRTEPADPDPGRVAVQNRPYQGAEKISALGHLDKNESRKVWRR